MNKRGSYTVHQNDKLGLKCDHPTYRKTELWTDQRSGARGAESSWQTDGL